MRYIIPITTSPVNWEEIDALSVAEYSWGCAYRPEVTAKAAFVPGEGFTIRTACKEANPRATYTEPNSPVCRDSCLEFFAAFDISKPDYYINFECNANGCLLCEYGTSTDRSFIDSLGCEMPVPKAYREGEYWGWELFVPLKTLNQLFGEVDYKEGTVIRANVFKCGDDTEQKHYGSWQPIDWPVPSFHRPQFFGEMVLHKA